MKTWKAVALVIVCCVIVLVSTYVAFTNSLLVEPADVAKEKVLLGNVNITNSAIYVDVTPTKTIDGSVTFNYVIFKDNNGNILANYNINSTVAQGQSMTLRLNYNQTISNGDYFILATESGGIFPSQPLNVS
jgi:hypothetical protein